MSIASPIIIGKFYSVPAVRVLDWNGFEGWMPVYGPMHSDLGVVNFPYEHFHIDWRFVNEPLYRAVVSMERYRGAGVSYLHGRAIQCPSTRGKQVIAEGPVLRRMKCKRPMPPYPFKAAQWLRALREQYACAKLKDDKCPHRGVPVWAMIRDGDVLTCPAHGLQWHAITGELITARAGEQQ